MAGESNPGSGAGTGSPPGAAGGGAPGAPGAAGAGAGGGGAGAGGGAPAGGDVQAIDRSVLPDSIRNRPAHEIKFILNNLASSLERANQDKNRLETENAQLRTGSQGGKPGKGTSQPVDDDGDDDDNMPLEDLVLKNPKKAILKVVGEQYGGTVAAMGAEVEESALDSVRGTYADWREHETDVLDLIQQSGAGRTRRNLDLAYATVVGRKTIEQRAQAARAAANTETITEPTATPALKPLEGLEKEVFENTRNKDGTPISLEDWYKYRNKDMDLGVKVPTGKAAN